MVEFEGKQIRLNAAQKKIHVCDGQRATTPVASRARIRTGAVWTNAQPHTVEPTDRTASGSYRFDGQHRRHDPHTRFVTFEFDFKFAILTVKA